MKTLLLFLTATMACSSNITLAQSFTGDLITKNRINLDSDNTGTSGGGTNNPDHLFKPVNLVVNTSSSTFEISWIMPGVSAASYFLVSRSTNGQQWETLGEIEAITSEHPQENYLFMDDAPLFGTSYYRLTAVTYNGELFPLDMETAHRKAPEALLYPNPAKDQCKLVLTHTTGAQDVELEICNLQGNRLLTQSLHLTNGVNTVSLNTNLLSPGQYVIRSTSGDVSSFSPMRLTICN